ncbi:MAG: hypothetical protein H6515_13180, partial [Microthrixaceae bacterium]|nr:hypothetical protein [Microthrixaceae bacterium]
MAARDGSSTSTEGFDTHGAAPPSELRSGLRVEAIGEDLLILDAEHHEVHLIAGAAVEDDDEAGPSRRRVLAAGGTALAAATVTTFALADPAAAATGCTNGVTPTPYDKFTTPGSTTFYTGQVTSILVRAWGGGGPGGGGNPPPMGSDGAGGIGASIGTLTPVQTGGNGGSGALQGGGGGGGGSAGDGGGGG